MHIEVFFSPGQVDEMSLRGRTVVVIDVLRASTSIITALQNGAKEVIPVATVESAVKISGNLFGDVILLAGERNGRMIEGFNLGNSPCEYTEERVKGKSIIFNSTNGSQAMVKARHAREMLICGFVNISTVAHHIARGETDIAMVCAGKSGMFAIEDAVCAGMLAQKLAGNEMFNAPLSDGTVAAQTLYKTFGRNILKMIRNSEHGRFLAGIGFEADLMVCAGVDTIPVLPQLSGSVLKIRREAEQKKEDIKVAISS